LACSEHEHKEATDRESEARSAVTRATNRLNAAQKNLDKHLDTLRKGAPWNTEWNSRKGQPVA
jgi:hypothetical protein